MRCDLVQAVFWDHDAGLVEVLRVVKDDMRVAASICTDPTLRSRALFRLLNKAHQVLRAVAPQFDLAGGDGDARARAPTER